MESFDLDGGWALSERVALRPEPFGALAYDFSTRRLSFLKDPVLVAVVRTLASHESARSACRAVGVEEPRLPAFTRALAALASSGMIEPT